MKRLTFALLFVALAALPGWAMDQPLILDTPPPTRSAPQFQKLDSGLNRILVADDPQGTAQSLGYRMQEGRIQIVAQVAEGGVEELEAWLTQNGAAYVSSAANYVQAFVPLGVLPVLNQDPSIWSVRRPDYLDIGLPPEETESQKLLTFTSEGLQAMNAQAWHAAGYSGQGLKIGIIDGGFMGSDPLVGVELPDSSRIEGQSFGGTNFYGSKHGTACAEIVYDLTPDVSMMYLAAVSTVVDMVNAGVWLDSMGVDIITMSMGFGLGFGPGDGSGPLADLIDVFVDSGGLIVVSAGNSGDNHWQGTWSDQNSNNALNFAADAEINYLVEDDGSTPMWVPAFSTVNVTLVWNQWQRPTTNLDFCLYGWVDGGDPLLMTCSDNVQSGLDGQLPVERISFLTLTGGYGGVAVWHTSGGTNVDMEIEYEVGRPRYLVPGGSIALPADTASAISVGALDAGSPYPIEDYSSRGPTNGPGGALSGGFIKPDIAGYANVSTASFGPRSGAQPFNGTSSACPHTAGGAAIVWSAHPGWSNNQVRSYLENNAIDMGPSGKDNNYGFGRLYLGNPPSSCTYNISPTSATFGASGGSDSFSVTTQAGCTWTATSNNGWIHITGGSSGSGNGTVSYSVDANGGSSSRTGTISAAGKTFTITQAGASGCSYSISPTSQSFGPSGGNGSVSVNTTAGCTWTASSNNAWIHVTSGSSGTGSGTVNYSVDANSGSSRTGTMTVADRTFTVTQSGGGGGDTYTYQVAGIAHAGGAGGSVWRSTLCVTNRSGSTANLTLVYRMASNSVTRTHVLQNGRIKEWEDVAVSLFNQSANTSGAIEITSDAPVMVVARTYNEAPDGTFGQGMPGNDDSETLASGQMGVLPQLKKTSAFRTNVGLMNHGSAVCNVRIKLYSETGSQIGNTIDTSVPANQWKQINDVFNEAGVGQCAIGYATIEVRTAGGKIWAYGSVVDNGTGDPTTISLFIE